MISGRNQPKTDAPEAVGISEPSYMLKVMPARCVLFNPSSYQGKSVAIPILCETK